MKLFLSLMVCVALTQQAKAQDPAYPGAPAAPQNLTSAEYFFDADPGFGNGTPITITPGVNISNMAASVNTSGLSNGIHRFCLRTFSNEGDWSITNIVDFLVDFNPAYPTLAAAPQNLVKAEYFIDTDPGFGAASVIPITPGADLPNVAANINTAGLSNGVHQLWLRTQGAEGKWSITNQKDFLVDENPAYPTAPAAPGNLVYAEYFFDTDPGFGNGTLVPFTPSSNLSNVTISANVSGLTDGSHNFFLRTLDDWSLTGFQTFFKGSPLPLHFLSFYAKNKERSVNLEWKTDNEVNTSHFDVERSADGTAFSKIGNVTANNQTGIQTYTLDDIQPLPGKNFYRLKQVDKDGKFEYSKTVVVNRNKGLEVQVFPNPAGTSITVLMPLRNSEQSLTLIGANAQTIKRLTVPAGVTTIDVPLTGLTAGRYFIKWKSGDEVSIKPFIKL